MLLIAASLAAIVSSYRSQYQMVQPFNLTGNQRRAEMHPGSMRTCAVSVATGTASVRVAVAPPESAADDRTQTVSAGQEVNLTFPPRVVPVTGWEILVSAAGGGATEGAVACR